MTAIYPLLIKTKRPPKNQKTHMHGSPLTLRPGTSAQMEMEAHVPHDTRCFLILPTLLCPSCHRCHQLLEHFQGTETGKPGLNLEFLDLLEFLTGKWQLEIELVLTSQLLTFSPVHSLPSPLPFPSLGEVGRGFLGTCGIKSHPAVSTCVCTLSTALLCPELHELPSGG